MEKSQEALIRRCQAGHTDAFGELVKAHAGRAVAAAFLMLGCHHEALDASQDAFVRAWRHIRRFSGKSSFYTWYYAILRNLCLDRLRHRRKNPSLQLSDYHSVIAEESDPVLLASRNEQAQQIWNAILQLPIKHREIIIMSHFQGMSYKQIAGLLDIPMGTVMSRLHKARKALRTKLTGNKP